MYKSEKKTQKINWEKSHRRTTKNDSIIRLKEVGEKGEKEDSFCNLKQRAWASFLSNLQDE